MRDGFSSIYTLLVFFALVFILGLEIFNLYSIRESNEAKLALAISKTESTITKNYETERSFSLVGFSDEIRQLFEQEPRLRMLVLHSPERGVIYRYQITEAPILLNQEESNKPEFFTPEYRSNSFLIAFRRENLDLIDGQAVSLDLFYSVLSRKDVYPSLLRSLIAISSLLFLTTVAIVVLRRKQDKVLLSPEDDGVPPDAEEEERVMKAPPPQQTQKEDVLELFSSSGAREAPFENEPFSQNEEEVGNEIGEEEEWPMTDSSSNDLYGTPEEDQEEESFSPPEPLRVRLDLERSSFLDDRLGLELDRATSFNQDLSLALIRNSSLEGNQGDYTRFVESLQASPAYQRGLTFEQGPSSLALILPQMGLEDALGRLEVFVEDSLPSDLRKETHIGVTSRGGRLISGTRLQGEASAALEKAFLDATPLLGFRSDPEKFRQYLEETLG